MSPVVSSTTAHTSEGSSTFASRSLARRSSFVTRAFRRFSSRTSAPSMSSSGSLSTRPEKSEDRSRSHAIPYCKPKTAARAKAARKSGGSFKRTVEATMEPIATVMTKSKLDILEKLRRPDSRVSVITMR